MTLAVPLVVLTTEKETVNSVFIGFQKRGMVKVNLISFVPTDACGGEGRGGEGRGGEGGTPESLVSYPQYLSRVMVLPKQ